MDYDEHVFKQDLNLSLLNITDFEMPPNKYVVEEIVLIVFALIGISANSFVIYMVCYFRKLQTSTNVYLINWAIADIGSVLITIGCFRVISSGIYITEPLLCFYFSLGGALLFNVILFMSLLTTDWCLTAYLPRAVDRFQTYTKVIIIASWSFCALYSVTSTIFCSTTVYFLVFHFSIPIEFTALLLFIFVLHVIKLVKKIRKRCDYNQPITMLLLPTVFTACWSLSWMNLILADLASEYYLVTESPLFLHPTINFALLVIFDKDFKACFFQVLRSSRCAKIKRGVQNKHGSGNQEDSCRPSASDLNRQVY